MRAPSAALARLAGKYRELSRLRRAEAAGAVRPPREAFRALAAEFPGALRELDLAPLELLDARASALEAASAADAQREAWMDWLWARHALLRAALRIRASRPGRAPEGARLEALAAEAREAAGFEVDIAFVSAALDPPAGRLVLLVEAELARAFGVPEGRMRETLFPFARPKRHT